jgi:hypothetical protein
MDEADLKLIDNGLSSSVQASPVGAANDQYCISAKSGDYIAKVTGPGGTITSQKGSATWTECP